MSERSEAGGMSDCTERSEGRERMRKVGSA